MHKGRKHTTDEVRTHSMRAKLTLEHELVDIYGKQYYTLENVAQLSKGAWPYNLTLL